MKIKATEGLHSELYDIAKGTAGAFIFGIPLLYTMEVWFDGKTFSTQFHLLFLLSMIILNMLFSYVAGFEGEQDKKIFGLFRESITSCALGILLAGIIVWLTGAARYLHADGLGVILLEGLIMSFGISFANLKFAGHQEDPSRLHLPFALKRFMTPGRSLAEELGASVIGALVYSLNVAPTEEVVLIASRVSSLNLLAILGVEFGLTYLLLTVVHKHKKPHHFFQYPIVRSLQTFSVALVVSALLILILGYGSPTPSSQNFLPLVIILALPATVGASAGRLIL